MHNISELTNSTYSLMTDKLLFADNIEPIAFVYCGETIHEFSVPLNNKDEKIYFSDFLTSFIHHSNAESFVFCCIVEGNEGDNDDLSSHLFIQGITRSKKFHNILVKIHGEEQIMLSDYQEIDEAVTSFVSNVFNYREGNSNKDAELQALEILQQ